LLEAPGLVSAAGELVLPLLLVVFTAAWGYAAIGLHLGFGGRLAPALGHGARVSDDRGAVAVRRILAAIQMGAAGAVGIAGFLLASGLDAPSRAETETTATLVMGVASPGGSDLILNVLDDVPGIQAGSLATRGSLGGVGLRDYVTAECGNCFKGGLPTPFWSAYADHYAVTPSFFELAGLALTEGRPFDAGDDAQGARVAVVNRTFANVAFEGGKPLGHVIRVGRGMDDWYTVVGVVEDHPSAALGGREEPGEAVYLSLRQHSTRTAELLLQGPAEAVSELRARLSTAGVATDDPRTLDEHVADVRAQQGWAAGVAGLLSVLILFMAVAGTRALSMQVTQRRRHELAVRQVMGASPGRVLLHVLLGSGRTGLWGTAVMLFFGTMTVAFLRKAFGGVPAPGPLLYLVMGALLTLSAMVASWKAARAATRVPPASAMN
jgi:hypothetical protein